MRAFVVISCLAALASCGSPQSLRDVDPAIRSAKEVGTAFVVDAQLSMVSEGLAMNQVGMLVARIGEAIQDRVPGTPSSAKTLRLHVSFDATDRLGNQSAIKVATIDFPMSDIRQAKFANLQGTAPLNLAEDVHSGEDFSPVANYCSDDGNFAQTSEFCTLVAGQLAGTPGA